MKSNTDDSNITMHDGSKKKSIQLKFQPNQPIIYLGVISQINVDQTAQTSFIKEKANKLSRKLKYCHMPHYYAHIHQLCSINLKLTYSLVASSLNNKQLQSIHSIIHLLVIASKGFNRNWPEGLRYGTCKFCELELIDCRVEQRLRKIQMIHKLLLYPEHQIPIQGLIEWYQI